MKENNIKIRIPKSIYLGMLGDLRRLHSFAFERVGFAYAASTIIDDETIIITFTD